MRDDAVRNRRNGTVANSLSDNAPCLPGNISDFSEVAPGLPDASCWPDLPACERERREALLRDIERRVSTDGLHTARPHADRARQFMPFAALKGYHDLARSKEFVPEPRREVTQERALALSQAVASLHKGDVVRIVHYEDGAYATTMGAVSEVVEAHRIVCVVRKPIPFDAIWSVEVV